MNSVDENGQLLFVDTFDRTSNALVIGKVGKGAAFHLRKTFFDSLNIVPIPFNLYVSGEMGTGYRELQLFLPAPKNQNNLFPRVLTFQEEMVSILQNHQKKLRHNHYLAERELYQNIFGLMW
ncbi:hypothetical protein ACE1MS_09625 [Lysinibacillus sp. fkY74-1]